MIPNIVGPPIVGATELRSFAGKNPEKDLKRSGSESFGKALEEKLSSSEKAPEKEMARTDRPKEKASKEESSEKPEVRPDKKVALKKQEAKAKGAPSRQQAIKEFMDSFESEFEIPPTRLVDAMASLKDEELNLTPEDTAEAVIAQLDLDPSENGKAQAMYVGLLAQLKQLEAPAQVPKAMVLPSEAIQPQAMQWRTETAMKQQNLSEASVDRLNSKFWNTDQAKAGQSPLSQRMMVDEESFANPLQDMQDAPELKPALAAQAQDPGKMKDALAELPPHLRGQMSESISPQLLAALAAKQAVGVPSENAEVPEEALPESEGLVATKEALPGPQAAKNEKVLESFMEGNSDQGSQFSQQQDPYSAMADSQNSKESFAKELAKEKLTTKGAEFKESMTGLEALTSATSPKVEAMHLGAAVPVAAAMGQQAPTAAQNQATVQSLMNQAQYLVKKGGGEVKVEMTPEGMGTIHLKLQVQDGKVNMQMSADTAEAKKTIESGLAELKTSLAAHKLSVDHVKVDFVSGPSTDTALQNQTDQNNNGQREGQRQFWNQFNENFGSQGRRESYTQEGVNLRGYGQQGRAHDPLKPVDAKVETRAVAGKGRGLNLVA